jgi:hypothetical protein
MRARRHTARPAIRARLGVQTLEDRTTPTVSSITGNFNGTGIPAGDTVWFSSVAKVSGLGTDPASLHVTGGTVSFTANGTPYTVAVPDTTVTFTQLAVRATTTYSPATGWLVTVPAHFSGNVFVGGTPFLPPGGLPGGIKHVTWRADFAADTAGLKVNWQWAAGVYSSFGDPAGLGVKSVDDSHVDAYPNSDHAGTPEAFKRLVVGGGTGGGGSNFTGSYSPTASFVPDVSAPPPPPPATGAASLSGTLYQDASDPGSEWLHWIDAGDLPLEGVEVDLRDAAGNLLDITYSAADGTYSFTGLAAGTYTVEMGVPPWGSVLMFPEVGGVVAGTHDGMPEGTWQGITDIQLGAGDAGTGYNMGVWLSGT